MLGDLDGKCSCGNVMPCGIEVKLDGKRYIRHDNILDEALEAYQTNYNDESITKDDIFCYVYGLLHSPLYKDRYQNNLRRELPRIPMAPPLPTVGEDSGEGDKPSKSSGFWAFSKAGRALSELHLNYETCQEHNLLEERNFTGNPEPNHYQLGTRRMRWTDKETKHAIRVNDTSPSATSHPTPTATSSTAARPSNGSSTATTSKPTKPAASSTTPTSGSTKPATTSSP